MSAEAPKAIYVSSDISDCSDEIWAEVIKYDQSDIKYVRADIAEELIAALKAIVNSLSEHDEEGLIEHVEPMIKARAAIAKATEVAT